MEKTKKINKVLTNEEVRVKYRSILQFCKAHGASSVAYYHAVNGERGGKGRRAPETERILAILREEGLLVEFSEDSPAQAANS